MLPDSGCPGSVTEWIEDLRNDDPDATVKIWNRFTDRLVAVARKQLRNSPCRVVDGDVVAADAFRDFFKRGPDGFAKLVDRNDLWYVLVMIAERRATDAIRSEKSQRRGGGRVINAAEVHSDVSHDWMDSLSASTRPPDVELELLEAFEERLTSLESDLDRQIAINRLDGMGNREISNQHGISLRSVERKLENIRKVWSDDGSANR